MERLQPALRWPYTHYVDDNSSTTSLGRKWPYTHYEGPTPTASSHTLAFELVESQMSLAPQPLLEWRASTRVKVIVLTMCIITCASALDATSISVALPIIAEALRGTAIQAFWTGTSFLLCSTVFQPTFASFSNIFGRKPIIIVALVFFTIGSIVTALANGFTVALVGRCIQGIGGGGLISLTEILITDMVPLRKRGLYFASISGTWSLGSVCGPIVGGGFAGEVSWRWIFWINLPFCIVGFVLVPLFLKLHQRPNSIVEKLAKVDWLGIFLFTASLTSLLIPVSWGGIMYEWSYWRTFVPLTTGSIGLCGFLAWEVIGTENPMINMKIFTTRNAAANYFGAVMQGIILWSMLYFLPFYFITVKDMTPMMAGIACFPETFTICPVAVIAGIIVSKTGRYRWSLWTGWTLTTLGVGIMCLLDVDTPVHQWVFIDLVSGIGIGMLYPSLNYAIQSAAKNADMATAVAMFAFLRMLGQCLGIAISGVIFQNVFKRKLSAFPELAGRADAYARNAAALVQYIKTLPRESVVRRELVESYAGALKVVWISMAGFAVAGLVVSGLTEGLSLDRELETEQGVVERY